jgi:hypothetical protein
VHLRAHILYSELMANTEICTCEHVHLKLRECDSVFEWKHLSRWRDVVACEKLVLYKGGHALNLGKCFNSRSTSDFSVAERSILKWLPLQNVETVSRCSASNHIFDGLSCFIPMCA